MNDDEKDGLREIAGNCVELVRTNVGRELDWTVGSLAVLDDVCRELLADGPLDTDRIETWWKLVGGYLGEVVVRVHAGEWVDEDGDDGPYAVRVGGTTGYPFATAARVLAGEPATTLSAFAHTFAAGTERGS